MDFATSDSAEVQAQLDRLAQLSLPQGRFGLETMQALMKRLGDPHLPMPPVFHVAGTNGKGSTCAFLRAILEAQGLTVHVATSPHLVRYNERIRMGGKLIADAQLAGLLAEVLDRSEDLAPSFFEITIAASFLAFSREAADVCVVEVGLGGRFDATNVVRPAVCGIAALGIDHERFLLAPEDGVPSNPLGRIAFEKAGIAKPGIPLITLDYPGEAEGEIIRAAGRVGAPLAMCGRDWEVRAGEEIYYRDCQGELTLPRPALPGEHQIRNAALAVAMVRHQNIISVSSEALAEGLRAADWPARLQLMAPGPLTGERTIWLDGGHNPDAGEALAKHFAGQQLHLIVGMLANKNPAAIVQRLCNDTVSLTVVPVPSHEYHTATTFGPGAAEAADLPFALARLPDDGLPVLIAGSLYLAGEALRLNRQLPD